MNRHQQETVRQGRDRHAHDAGVHMAASMLVCFLTISLYSMDGICIASLQQNSSYLSGVTFGKLVKYELKDDVVIKVDTLPDVNAGSPRLDLSGTYYAYVKWNGTDFFSRTLVIKPLYGNPASSVEIPLPRGANWIWWVENNTFFYSVNPVVNNAWTDHNVIRKLTLSRSNGRLVADDRLWVKTPKGMQGGFVGLDLTGTKLSYKTEPTSDSYIVSGDSTKAPTPVSVGMVGCGNSVSPSGTWWTQFPGGHWAVGWGKWDGSFSGAEFFSKMDSSWAVAQNPDPMRNLEVHAIIWGLPWRKSPLGSFGAENNYSQNSDDWFVCETGAVGDPVSAVNAIAINRATQKAINITRIPPVKQTYAGTYSSKTSFEFRYDGDGAFPGGVQLNADRPTLWCSSQADVLPSLWKYIQNRATHNEELSTLLGLPLSQIPGSSIQPKSTAQHTSMPELTDAGQSVVFPTIGEFSVRIIDLKGRTLVHQRGSGRFCSLPRLSPGSYLLTAQQGDARRRTMLSVL